MGSRLRETVRSFELFCEVSPGDHVKEPYIIKKYPEYYKNEAELKNIPKFTFPCQFESSFVQHYSFVLTSVDSKYTFCFCRYDPNANTALVLMSNLPWHDIFYKLLNCIANLMKGPDKAELSAFLEACRIRPPMPGHTLRVTYNAGHNVFSCQCPDTKLPSIPDNCNLTEYFSAVDSKCMAGLWAALLHERRVAIIATKPSRLSACVQAANATLFPMSWQHIFIPILPKHLVDYLLAPMPFLIGVPREVMESVRMAEIGDVVVLDVDRNELRSPFNDLESLPSDLVSNLRKELSDKHALGDAVSRAFLRALVCLIGGYRDAIRIEKGQLITFNPEAFLRTRKNMQPFLEKILQSQIFQQFIDERLDLLNSGRGFNDEFEVECNLHAERLSADGSRRLKQQYRDWARHVRREGGAFFRNVKDKANPAVQSAVKSVRQGGKNMKSAVRGLKNKMPKTGSRPSSINTTDESRNSCGSATPVSSASSSDSSPAREPPAPASAPAPAAVSLDLLTEMDFLFSKRRDSLPGAARSFAQLSVTDKSKTLSPSVPPRLPDRPNLPSRYPIIPTRTLLDFSDAPKPPPRSNALTLLNNSQFVSNITKNEVNGSSDFHTSTIRFSEFGKDKAKLKLTMSNSRLLPPPPRPAPLPLAPPGAPAASPAHPAAPASAPPPPLSIFRPRSSPRTNLENTNSTVLQEPFGSEVDLIKLEDSPLSLASFDPLRCKQDPPAGKMSTDSALLHEYGLDFSRLGLPGFSCPPPLAPAAAAAPAAAENTVPEGWTTFN